MSGLNMLGSNLRRRYMAMGPKCVEEYSLWREMISKILEKEGIDPVTDWHLRLMDCVRQYYLEKKRAPNVREICQESGLTLNQFFALFPDWPHTLFSIDGIVSTVLGIPVWNVDF